MPLRVIAEGSRDGLRGAVDVLLVHVDVRHVVQALHVPVGDGRGDDVAEGVDGLEEGRHLRVPGFT